MRGRSGRRSATVARRRLVLQRQELVDVAELVGDSCSDDGEDGDDDEEAHCVREQRG